MHDKLIDAQGSKMAELEIRTKKLETTATCHHAERQIRRMDKKFRVSSSSYSKIDETPDEQGKY